jgi:CheY-like chemotaxis protein
MVRNKISFTCQWFLLRIKLMSETFLIAAHDPWLLQLLRVYTEESGFRVVQAHEGQDVLPMVEKEVPTAILLQADLTGRLKGSELLHELQTNPKTHCIPVIAFYWPNEGEGELGNSEVTFIQEPITYETFLNALLKLGICT